jgi:hypothetical protein
VRIGENLGQQLKRNASGATVAAVAPPMATYGELFADGTMIELIAGVHNGNPALMLWDGAAETIGARVEHCGQLYEPAQIDGSVLRELTLPTQCCPHGGTRDLLAEICKLVTDLVGLDEKSASLVGRIVLCSHLLDAVSVAPAIMIVGPDAERAKLLMTLLRCLCRHALLLTGVTPAGFCSLASGARFTYLISQSSLSDNLRKLLDDASSRDRKIPSRGGLLDLFGVQIIHSDPIFAGDSWPTRSIQIAMIPTEQELPAFDLDAEHQITKEFQAKLLSFRRTNLGVAHRLHFDASKFTFALRDLARSIAAATPDDLELQAEVFGLLREKDLEIRSDRWIDPSAIAGEAVSVAGFESPGGTAYVSDLAKIAQEIQRRRGEELTIEPAVFGKRLKLLGFATERDAKGKKLHLTEAVRNRAQQLVRDFGDPAGSDNPSQKGKGS